MVKEEYTVRIGSNLRKVLDKQKEIIKQFTYGIAEPSDWEAGEIIADKVLKERLLE